MEIQKQLEIIIPTYNRKVHITHTLEQLTAADSPVKNCSITVLDNASTDGSSEVIESFAKKFANVTHIRHPKNIGGNANITRSYEMATAPYVWVVCDDDSFKWDAWTEIEKALETEEYDLILTRKDDLKGSNNIAKIVRQCTFVPAAIYHTRIITNGVLMNMYNNIPNMFPHLALVCDILNKKGLIFLPQGEIMDKCTLDIVFSGDDWNTRGAEKSYIPASTRNMFWTVGFLNSLQMIEDPKLRAYVLENVGKHGFFGYIFGSFRKNYTFYNGNKLNEAFVKNDLNFTQRIKFFFARHLLKLITLFSKKKKK